MKVMFVTLLLSVVIAVPVYLAGHIAGGNFVVNSIKESCVKDNPSVPVGEIRKYCNNRLYLKD